MTRKFQVFMAAIFAVALGVALTLSPLALAAVTDEAGSRMLLEKEPKKAKGVVAVKKEAKNGEDVVVVGRIGGRENPWIKGAAAFAIVDESAKSCDQLHEHNCPTPWDYCCTANIAKLTMLVSFVDESGKLIRKDARELLKLKELQTVVIKGKAKRDKAGNVTVQGSQIFVRKPQPTVLK